MKPRKEDQQLRVSLAYSVALQALKPKPSPRMKEGAWMQAPIEASRRAVEKCFCLTSSLIG